MKFKLFPVPHIIIYSFDVTNSKTGYIVEQHYFLTRRGARKFMEKYSDELSKEGYNCSFGGEPLWFW